MSTHFKFVRARAKVTQVRLRALVRTLFRFLASCEIGLGKCKFCANAAILTRAGSVQETRLVQKSEQRAWLECAGYLGNS